MRYAIAAASVVALASCGSSGSPAQEALRDTARNLDTIRSATLDLRMTAESAGASKPVGFAMTGRFSLPKERGLPVADLRVSEMRGERTTTVSFVSTGTAAFVVRDGRATRLSSAPDVGGEGEGLGTLRIDSWLRDPVISDGGDGTELITAGLDVATAFDDLGRLGQRFGASGLANLRPLDADARERLAAAAKDSKVEVRTGEKDRLLRRLVLTVTLEGDVPEGLRSLVPVTLSLSLSLADHNRPIEVRAPTT